MLQGAAPNRAPLATNAYHLLPLTSVKPRGWLMDQLHIQAEGLSGHLDEFWVSLVDSGWTGGNGESWERGPYYMDGLVPLAYLTGDEKLIAKARRWVEWTLTHQREDGSIGPAKNLDWWPNMVMLKTLTQYYEATGDKRVIPLMERYLAYHARLASHRPLKSWASYRWQDEALSIIWLYNRNGDPKLLDLARALRHQGYDWLGQFASFRYTGKMSRATSDMASHGVNNGMAIKTPGVAYLLSRDAVDREGIYRMLAALDRYHALPNGMFSGDEHYAGSEPHQGIELCAVVESMFSLEHLIAITGDAALGDRLEKIAYNALPGTFSADMWAHQYDQQPNQVLCSVARRDWSTNGPDSNLFGLEPNFGCCTANMHQGWPKFAANLWMETPEGGLAAVAYAPSEVSLNGIGIIEETGYPFRDSVRLRVKAAKRFPLELRIPAWAQRAAISVNGQQQSGVRPGAFFRIDREWRDGDTVEISLPMETRVDDWRTGGVVVTRGPLVYSLRIDESWRKVKQAGPAADWEVFPRSPWNYGLPVEPVFAVEERPLLRQPFSAGNAPVLLKTTGRRVPDWMMANDSAGPVPRTPHATPYPEESLTLIPYGAAKLRVTVFPTAVPARRR